MASRSFLSTLGLNSCWILASSSSSCRSCLRARASRMSGRGSDDASSTSSSTAVTNAPSAARSNCDAEAAAISAAFRSAVLVSLLATAGAAGAAATGAGGGAAAASGAAGAEGIEAPAPAPAAEGSTFRFLRRFFFCLAFRTVSGGVLPTDLVPAPAFTVRPAALILPAAVLHEEIGTKASTDGVRQLQLLNAKRMEDTVAAAA
mmetsp:Transcript_29253/g.64891  ORF Transcript_29253/g.64891 Transcript_29253/m.64891 type:complete len:204 (+) Transcript_29253:610-1221(+)